MYFPEQGNVDDDATLITIFLVSFNLQSCCLMQSAVSSQQSAVCSLQMSYTVLTLVFHKIVQLLQDLKLACAWTILIGDPVVELSGQY